MNNTLEKLRIKKILVMVIGVITTLIALLQISCGKEYELIDDSQIFNQIQEEYFVYFIKDNCQYCESISDEMIDYQQEAKKKDNLIDMYIVNLNNGEDKSMILRAYSGKGAQGKDNDFFVNGATSYSELYIPATPSLIYIYTENGEKISRYVAEGRSSVQNTVKKLYEAQSSKYTVNYDLNYDNKTYTKTYNNWELNVSFDIPTREGYTFIGWQSEGEFVEKFENKDYSLKAIWVVDEYEYILDTEIFSQPEEEYFIYFMKDSCQYCEMIKENVLQYIYMSNTKDHTNMRKLYIVNLNKDGVKSKLLRSYQGEGGQGGDNHMFIDGLTNIDDMYISATPTLIEIKKKTSYYVGSGSTEIKNILNIYTVKNNEEVSYKEYTIKFDLGYDNKTLPDIVYKEWQTITNFVTPTREGYIFLGWQHNDTIITSVTGGDYTLVASWLDEKYNRNIDDIDIFNQKEVKYLVYLMKDGCTYCNKIKEDVNEYIYNLFDEKYKNSTPLYIVNLKPTNGSRSQILRAYSGNGGEDDGNTFVTGAKSIDELYIPSTPTLISVSYVEGEMVAKLEAIGSTNVVKALEKNLVKDGNPIELRKNYTITFDLGDETLPKINNQIFYHGASPVLPNPSKEGNVFVGWEEIGSEGNIVTKLENRNYNLKAKWASIEEVKKIDADQLFLQEKDCYIIFITKGMKKYNEIMEEVLKLQMLNDVNILACELTGTIIHKSYDGEDGEGYNNKYYVSKAQTWEELRIPNAPTIISITKDSQNGTLKKEYLGVFSAEVLKILEGLWEK